MTQLSERYAIHKTLVDFYQWENPEKETNQSFYVEVGNPKEHQIRDMKSNFIKGLSIFLESSANTMAFQVSRELTIEEETYFKNLPYKQRKRALFSFFRNHWKPLILKLKEIGVTDISDSYSRDLWFQLEKDQLILIPNLPYASNFCFLDLEKYAFQYQVEVTNENSKHEIENPRQNIFQLTVLQYEVFENKKTKAYESPWIYFYSSIQYEVNLQDKFAEYYNLKKTTKSNILLDPKINEDEDDFDKSQTVFEILECQRLGTNDELPVLAPFSPNAFVKAWLGNTKVKKSIKNLAN